MACPRAARPRSPPAFSQAPAIRSGAGLVASTSAEVVQDFDQLSGIEKIEVMLGLLGLGRGGEDNRVAGLRERLEQGAGPVEGSDLVDHLGVELGLGLAHLVAVLLLDVALPPPRRRSCRHPCRCGGESATAARPHRRCRKCPRPGDRVVIVAVDEGAVDVDDDCQATFTQGDQRSSLAALKRVSGTRAQGGPGAGSSPDGEGSARGLHARLCARDTPARLRLNLPQAGSVSTSIRPLSPPPSSYRARSASSRGRSRRSPGRTCRRIRLVSAASPAGRQAACRGSAPASSDDRGAGAASRAAPPGIAARAIVWLRGS